MSDLKSQNFRKTCKNGTYELTRGISKWIIFLSADNLDGETLYPDIHIKEFDDEQEAKKYFHSLQ